MTSVIIVQYNKIELIKQAATKIDHERLCSIRNGKYKTFNLYSYL